MANLLTEDTAVVGDIKTLQPGQIQKAVVGTVARTDTAAKTLGTLPANATLIGITIQSAAGSNAGTTAALSLGFASGTGTEILNGASVLGAAGAGQNAPNSAVLGQPGSLASAAQTLTGKYAETGTASTAGGPWLVVAEFVAAL